MNRRRVFSNQWVDRCEKFACELSSCKIVWGGSDRVVWTVEELHLTNEPNYRRVVSNKWEERRKFSESYLIMGNGFKRSKLRGLNRGWVSSKQWEERRRLRAHVLILGNGLGRFRPHGLNRRRLLSIKWKECCRFSMSYLILDNGLRRFSPCGVNRGSSFYHMW